MTGRRQSTGVWIILGLLAVTLFAVVNTILTRPTEGERLDPDATTRGGARALVTLIRERGVEVVVAHTVADVEREARPDTLLVLPDADRRTADELRRLAAVPGDRLIVNGTGSGLDLLAPGLTVKIEPVKGPQPPDCALREADRAGLAEVISSNSYVVSSADPQAIRCYRGGLVRYHYQGREITVVDSPEFMSNAALARFGNAALAMNLTGARPRVVWFSYRPDPDVQPKPDPSNSDRSGEPTLSDLIPESAGWTVTQLLVAVALLALSQARRLGPLVAERLPVVVRSSESVEGRAQLYRATRARGQAAAALRIATLQRIVPLLGVGPDASQEEVVAAAARIHPGEARTVHHILFGPAPTSDSELLRLGQALDDMERQVRRL